MSVDKAFLTSERLVLVILLFKAEIDFSAVMISLSRIRLFISRTIESSHFFAI